MRAAIYARLSYDKNGDYLGVQRQEKACREVLTHQGWELVEVYADNDISAWDKNAHRPEYERMRADYAAGRFGALVVWDLDRLTRQPRQLEDWIEAASDRGLAVLTHDDHVDLRSHNGQMYARIKAAVSRQESDQKAARQRAAAKQRAELGRPWGPRRPFGYMGDKITPHPVEADVVRRIYADILAGESQGAVVRWLAEQGVTTTMGKPWGQPALSAFLRNPRNAGLRAYRGEIIGDAVWMPLVPREMWEATVAVLAQQSKRRAPKTRARHLLTGVAQCGVCGATLRTAYSPLKERQYACRTGHHVARRADLLEDMVTLMALGLLRRYGLAAVPAAEHVTDPAALVEEQDTLFRRMEALAEDYADGTLTKAQVRAANHRIMDRLRQIEQELAVSPGAGAIRPLVEAEDVQAAWCAQSVTRRREVIRMLMVVRVNRTRKGFTFDPDAVDILPRRDM